MGRATAGGCETDEGHSEDSPPDQGTAWPGRGPCSHAAHPAIVHQAELAGLEHPCFTSALLSAMVTCPQDNLANARQMTRSVL